MPPWNPEQGDVAFPAHRSRGVYVVVEESTEDRVTFIRHDPGQEPHKQTTRLSTFISRYTPFSK